MGSGVGVFYIGLIAPEQLLPSTYKTRLYLFFYLPLNPPWLGG